MLEQLDSLVFQKIFSFIIGCILGYLYIYVSPNTTIINASNNLDDIENKSLAGDKCFRYKKIETKCN